jgi:ABC-type branched-subunit amino acid transport system substrate-binding protein
VGVLGLTALALLVSACGGGGSSSGSSSGSGSGSDSGAEPIKFMTITTVGSPLASYPEIQEDAKAAAEAINKEGGVNGHEIESLFCNSKGDANTALNCVREAVKENVVAVVGREDLFNSQTTPILEAAGIPDIGGWSGGDPIDSTSKISFPMNAGSWGAYATTAFAMKEMGVENLGIASLDLEIALNQADVVEAAAKEAGVSTSGIVKVPIEGVTDYTPYSQQLKSQGDEGVVAILGPAAFEGIVKANAAVGIDPAMGVCVICGESKPKLLLGSPYPLATDNSNPGIAAFNKEREADGLEATSPTDPDVYSGLNAWLAMHVAAEVAKSIKGEVTASSMMQALETTEGLEVEHLTTFSPAKYGSSELGQFPRFPATPYYTFEVGEGGKFVATKLPPVEDPIKAAR